MSSERAAPEPGGPEGRPVRPQRDGGGRLRSARALVRTLRPHQWVKNAFVAAPLVFAQKLGNPHDVARAALAVLTFCALSGAVYAFNDVLDVDADRLHPAKCKRPVAAGVLSERAALACAGVLAIGALGGCLVSSWQLAIVAALYLAQNVAYTLRLKHIAFVDVALIASGFLLRVLAGATAIAVPTSVWLLLCTALLALLLGLGKRTHELTWALAHGHLGKTRTALAGYRLDLLWVAMIALALATCASFIAYTLDDSTVAQFHTNHLVYSAPFVAIAIVRFLWLTLGSSGEAQPTEAMLRDPVFLIDVAAAVVVMLYVIYG
ncbi:MAG TPA: UbiA prenyltransferase family protein [Kofleriaceae bacterium]|nr:UbiA prenyltransferase family protein [Kofleriaceae bacterium]